MTGREAALTPDPVERALSLLEDRHGLIARCPACGHAEALRLIIGTAPTGFGSLTLRCAEGCAGSDIGAALGRVASRSPEPGDAELFGPRDGDRPQTVSAAPGGGSGRRGRGRVGTALRTLASSVHKRTRACVACGRDFLVNPNHAKTHKCCSPACRARHHRRQRSGRPTEAATP